MRVSPEDLCYLNRFQALAEQDDVVGDTLDLSGCAEDIEEGVEDCDEFGVGVRASEPQPLPPGPLAAGATRASEDDGEEEAMRVQMVPLPSQPTPEERRMHELTHLPFRSWCRHCMMGKCKANPHARQDHEEASLPICSFD